MLDNQSKDKHSHASTPARGVSNSSARGVTASVSDQDPLDLEHYDIMVSADEWTDKVHGFSRSLAATFGVNLAAVVTGFALKLSSHKHNLVEGSYWYYDTLETLVEERWPYFSESGLWGITEKASEFGLLRKGQFNDEGYDKTTWYSLPANVQKEALTDVIRFDVQVAVESGIVSGVIYHNLRYHLLKQIEHKPGQPVYFHKINLKRMSRRLRIEHSTLKSHLRSLLNCGRILRRPGKNGQFTIPNINKSADKLAANVELVPEPHNSSSLNGQNQKQNGFIVKQNGFIPKENGFNSDNDTLYKPIRKPMETHPKAGEWVPLQKQNESANSDTRKNSNTASASDTPKQPSASPSSYEKLLDRCQNISFARMEWPDIERYHDTIKEVCSKFINSRSLTQLRQLIAIKDKSVIVDSIQDRFEDYSQVHLPSFITCGEYLHDHSLVILVNALIAIGIPIAEANIPGDMGLVAEVGKDIWSRLLSDDKSSFEEDAGNLVGAINWLNQAGWSRHLDDDRYALPPDAKKRFEHFLRKKQVYASVLLYMIEVTLQSAQEKKPASKTFDHFFYRRTSISLGFMLSKWDNVVHEDDTQPMPTTYRKINI